LEEPALRVSRLRVMFRTPAGATIGVDDVSFDVGYGRTLGIVGESGSGKSITAKAVMGILPPAASLGSNTKVWIGGEEATFVDRVRLKHFWGVKAAMVFQDPMTSLTPVLRVGKQITEPLRYHLGLS